MGMTEDLTNLVVVNLETGVKEKITVYQYDTARCIVFQFINGTEKFNLAGKTARIYMNKPDGELIFNDLETVSEEEGKASILLDENMLAVTGTMYCDITIYEGDKTISVPKFCINIMKPLRNDRNITSTAEYRALTDALANVDDFKTKVDNYNTYLEKLGTASPKGAFDSLDDLKAAFPLGDDSVYLVDVDGNYYVAIFENGEWESKFPYLTDELNFLVADLNERFDNAINATTTDTEIIDARHNSTNNTTYTTLAERLEADYSSIDSKLNSDYYYYKTPNQFTGYSNDADMVQALIDSGEVLGKVIFPRNGAYTINKTIKIPRGIDIDFNNCTFTFVDGTYTNNFGILVATDDGSTWQGRSRMDFVKLSKLEAINSTTTENFKCMAVGCGADIIGLSTANFYQSIKYTNNYIDYAHIDELHVSNHKGTLYAVEKISNGDEVWFNNCHIQTTSTNLNFIKVTASQGCRITGTINGNIYLYRCQASTISNSHLEKGTILVEDSTASIQDNFIWKMGSECIHIKDSEGASGHYKSRSTNLENNVFILKYEYNNYDTDVADVLLTNSAGRIHLVNNRREVEAIGGSYKSAYSTGISIKKIVGSNSYTILPNSNNMDISNELRIYDKIYNILQDNASTGYNILNTVSAEVANIEYKSTDTDKVYYYCAGIILDSTKQIGLINTDSVKRCTTSSDYSVKINIGKEYIGLDATLRIYKGTTSGTYEQYVDVPCVNSIALVDNGYSVNGFPWIIRDEPSDVDTLNKALGYYKLGNNTIVYGSGVPTTGTWKLGDRIIHAIPASDALTSEWICIANTEDGLGTWKRVLLDSLE